MTRLFTLASVLCALMLVTLLANSEAASAREYRHRHWRIGHYVYVDPGLYYRGCRIGWWQTLRYGHVRPHWAELCR